MPRKAAVAADPAAEAGQTEESAGRTRRSTRISSKPQSEAKASNSKAKKRKADAEDGDEDAGDDEEEAEKPASGGRKKKVKSAKAVEGSDSEDSATHIDIGGVLPADMKLKNEKDEEIVLSNLGLDGDKETKGIVLFLVPKADTPGCTTQACGFRDAYPDFSSTGFQVYCLSADKPTAQEKWKTKKSLPYPLLSDPERTLISALGAGKGGKTNRSHFVFVKQDGAFKLVEKRMPVKPSESPQLALDFIKTLSSDNKAPADNTNGDAEEAHNGADEVDAEMKEVEAEA